jgi:CspA family cold shock protein
MGEDRKRGVVKWFDNKRGFGFILDDQEKEYFVHYSAVNMKKRGYATLYEKQAVIFTVEDEGKGPRATDVTVL